MAAPKNPGAKAHERKTTRANLLLDAEAHQRLFVHALMSNQAAGEIVSRLISQHLRDYALPAKLSERSTKHDRAISPAEATLSAPSPALSDAA